MAIDPRATRRMCERALILPTIFGGKKRFRNTREKRAHSWRPSTVRRIRRSSSRLPLVARGCGEGGLLSVDIGNCSHDDGDALAALSRSSATQGTAD